MAFQTAGDLVAFALRAAGVLGVGTTAAPEDANDGLTMLNLLLSEWQLNRWFVMDLVEAARFGCAAAGISTAAEQDDVVSDREGLRRRDPALDALG